MRKYRYAVFDLDGTILDSMYIWQNVGAEFLKEIGVIPPPDLHETLKSMGLREAAGYFISVLNVQMDYDAIVDRINEMVGLNYTFNFQLKPGVREFLDKLKALDVKMCIATATDYPHVETALKRLGVFDCFEFILTCQQVKTGKENPKIYLEASKMLDADIDDVVIFEDALHAACTAKNAGFYVIGVYDSSADEDVDDLKKACDEYVYSLNDVRCF